MAEIRSQIEEAKAEAITLDDLESVPEPSEGVGPAITLEGLEQVLTTATATGQRFHPDPTIPGAYLLEAGGKKGGRHASPGNPRPVRPDVRLLTYGAQELTELLAEAGVEAHPLDQGRFILDG